MEENEKEKGGTCTALFCLLYRSKASFITGPNDQGGDTVFRNHHTVQGTA